MVFIMSGFVILRPEKNPTPRAMIAMMAANLPNVFFISRNVVRLIIDFIGHLPFQIFNVPDVIIHNHFLHSSALNRDDSVRHGCECLVVRYDYNCRSRISACILKELQHSLACVVIQSSGRLITEQKLWILCKRPCYGNSLLLTT